MVGYELGYCGLTFWNSHQLCALLYQHSRLTAKMKVTLEITLEVELEKTIIVLLRRERSNTGYTYRYSMQKFLPNPDPSRSAFNSCQDLNDRILSLVLQDE